MNIMLCTAARGGMRSVVERYRADGFLERHDVTLIYSHVDGGLLKRQAVLIFALARFALLLATRRVSLVHCHAAMRGSFWRKGLFARLARLRGIPVLFHLHGSEMQVFFERQPAVLQRAISRELSRASRVLVLSESWRAFVSKIAPDARPVVVPNYVPVAPIPPRDGRTGMTILFLGLIGPRKGTFDLLEAMAAVLRSRPDAKLLIGGNGQLAKAQALAATLGIQTSVEFLGWVDEAGRQEALRTADIYVLPSYNEGLPLSVLEAMASGLPVVTTTVGGIPEVVTSGREGLLIEPGDQAALAGAILTLADDPALRRSMGAAGHARVRACFSSEVVLERLSTIYAQVSAEPGRPRPAPAIERH